MTRIQVLFNGGIATLLVLTVWTVIGSEDKCLDSKESHMITSLIGGIIGQYCCCNGDTWSSELGILSNEEPRLITNFKPVRRGTNGGVTKAGLLAAAAAGTVIGLTFVVLGFFTTKCTSDVTVKQLFVIPLSALAGVCGSVIDSLLGATLQFSGFCSVRKKVVGKPGPTVKRISGLTVLDNNAVNLNLLFDPLPFLVNELEPQYLLHDWRKVYECLAMFGIPIPRYGCVHREAPCRHLDYFVEEVDFVEVMGTAFGNLVEKPTVDSTSTSNRQAKFRLSGWDILDFPTIRFHDLVPVPPDSCSSVSAAVMEKIGSFFTSILLLREPIREFLQEVSSTYRRTVVINDSGMSWVVQDAVSMPNTECYCFHTISVFTALSFACETTKKSLPSPVAEIIAELPPRENTFDSETIEYIKMQRESRKFYSVGLHNSCKEIEGVFIDLLEEQRENKQCAIGPLNPVEISKKKRSKQTHECFSWFDKQERNSVIYVSFGSTTTLSKEQINELAFGLEQSGQKFIWVLRGADKKGGDNIENIESGSNFDLPEGFEERIKDKGVGLIGKNWAPQLEILAHGSIGGFMSHCGWNSCIESISMGVPMAAWPIHSDQPRNTVLITKVLKIGIIVRDWENRDELVSAAKFENAVRNLMGSAEGEELRRRVTELSSAVKKSVMNGAIRKEMDSFVAHITR
ncbi:hypothetical protein MTR67_046081 [Solanum verrucosum]|uniref:Glycosyltransferase N-terminal domain-containing protein n=1 Tax=Solanum verrucosum TaxID=315347 RepID=A0AAF0ZV76_SOLVR|nr:hypothetical protein MTR67_046081 [Solanum verrucosum]